MNKSTLTLKSFIEAFSIPATLIRTIVAGNGGWDEFKEQAKELGYPSAVTMIQDFNTIKDCGFSYNDIAKALYGRLSNNDTDQHYIKEQVYNVLCWYIEEEVSRSFVDYAYQLEND